jgi:hypothetical protein
MNDGRVGAYNQVTDFPWFQLDPSWGHESGSGGPAGRRLDGHEPIDHDWHMLENINAPW